MACGVLKASFDALDKCVHGGEGGVDVGGGVGDEIEPVCVSVIAAEAEGCSDFVPAVLHPDYQTVEFSWTITTVQLRCVVAIE